jgi:lysophospholipase L1-like esterase
MLRRMAGRGANVIRLHLHLAAGLGAALTAIAVAATAFAETTAPARAAAQACVGPAELVRLDLPLKRTAQKIAAGLPLTIVAIGSSSTSGAGASSPAMTYPSRLAAELQEQFPRLQITVLNRGVGGETAREMLARFDRDVFAEKPDLVIWQAGSNSVLRDDPLAGAGTLLREGIDRLKAAGVDIVLMNPQYAPKVINKHDVDGMVDLIALTAKEANVALF